MKSWIEAALGEWKDHEVKLNLPTNIASIEAIEAALDLQFPDDLKQLYLVVNGFEGHDWQKNMFSLWSVERIFDEYAQDDDKDFIGSADFLISSHFIGFVRGKEGIYKRYSNFSREFLTDSFMNAIMMINSDSKEIY